MLKEEIVEIGAVNIDALYFVKDRVVCADKHTRSAFLNQLQVIGISVLPMIGRLYYAVNERVRAGESARAGGFWVVAPDRGMHPANSSHRAESIWIHMLQ
jgi:hypothetical protein